MAQGSAVSQAATTTTVVGALADAGVYSETPDKNYGSSSSMRLDSGYRPGYLRFRIPATPADKTLTAVTLRVRPKALAKGASRTTPLSVYTVPSTWNESTVTFNSRPRGESFLGSVPGGYELRKDLNIPLTGYTGPTDMVLYGADSVGTYFYTREAGSSVGPRLILTYTSAPTTTTTSAPTTTTTQAPTTTTPTSTTQAPTTTTTTTPVRAISASLAPREGAWMGWYLSGNADPRTVEASYGREG